MALIWKIGTGQFFSAFKAVLQLGWSVSLTFHLWECSPIEIKAPRRKWRCTGLGVLSREHHGPWCPREQTHFQASSGKMFEGRETSLQETHQFPAATAVPRPQQVDDVECKSAINQWSIVKPFGGCPTAQRCQRFFVCCR